MTSLDQGTVWAVVLGVAVVTYLIRISFLLGIDYLGELPPGLERASTYVPATILAGLLAPDLALVEGALALGPGNEHLVAGLAAFVVAWRTQSLLATVGVGMAALWSLQWLG